MGDKFDMALTDWTICPFASFWQTHTSVASEPIFTTAIPSNTSSQFPLKNLYLEAKVGLALTCASLPRPSLATYVITAVTFPLTAKCDTCDASVKSSSTVNVCVVPAVNSASTRVKADPSMA